jgi:transglutaminase-like putative cysteine protease
VRVEQDFTINNLDSPWLPAAYEPDRIDGVSGISYDPQSGSLITSKNTSTGLQYHVSSVLDVGQLNPALLNKAPAPAQGDPTMDRNLQLPTIPADVVALAQRITAGKTTEYDKALALQAYLRSSRFTYDETYDPHGDGPQALQYFLMHSHKGYCQQFAGSFGVMARALGIPTRLAIGWTWGSQDANGVWHVTDDDTHTWPEVFFPQVGWVPFEPTPSRGMPGAQAYTGVLAQQQGSAPASATATPTTKPAAAPAPAPSTRRPANPDRSAAGLSKKASHHGNWWLGPVIALGVISLIGVVWVVGLLLAGRVRAGRRRAAAFKVSAPDWAARAGPRAPNEASDGAAGWPGRRRWARLVVWLSSLRPAAAPAPVEEGVLARASILLAWADTMDLLAWWGLRRHPDETYADFARRAGAELRTPLSLDGDAERSLGELARAAAKAEYAATPLTAEEAEAADTQAASIRHGLFASATTWQKARLVLDPRVAVRR